MRHLLLLLLFPVLIHAAEPWKFKEALTVTGEPRTALFHHLDSAGRKSIALSGDQVAITWEDNRSGQPQIYFSSKSLSASQFTPPFLISTGSEAYEPAISGLGEGRFILAWEEDGAVVTRTVQGSKVGPPLKLSSNSAGHATLSSWNSEIYTVWREKRGHYDNLQIAKLSMANDMTVKVDHLAPLEPTPVEAPQLYPTIATGPAGVAVAWEDRREGHTRLLYSHSTDGRSFSEPDNLNEFRSNRNAYDKGNGVTRVALTTVGEDETVAVWMDKRRSKTGYGIYAAQGYEGGSEYGPNERVQSKKGDRLPHYNPAVSGNSDGDFVVAWDDYRNGNLDIWLSTYNDELVWSEDFTPPVASGEGEQSNPTATMDDQGNIHLAWIHAKAPGEPGSIRYAFGKKLH